MKLIGLTLSLLCLALPAAHAQPAESSGPSFDCDRASNQIEEMICSDDELSTLDAQLSKKYLSLRATGPNPENLRTHQRAWALIIRNACDDSDCLRRAYKDRIRSLSSGGAGTADHAAMAEGPAPNVSTTGSKPVDLLEKESTEAATGYLKVPQFGTDLGNSPPNNIINTASGSGSEWTPWEKRFTKIIILAAIASLVGLIFLGMTGKVVIFYDWKDFRTSLYIFFSGLLGLILSAIFYDDITAVWVILSLSALAIIYFSIQTIRLSILYNRNIIVGVIVGVFKMFMALFSILFVLGKLGDVSSKSSSGGLRVFSALVLAVFAWFLYQMINGERVYAEKGWD
ncbi:MAG: lysozyme inhibitor LprI family protein [Betaproteobacteria bacterium]